MNDIERLAPENGTDLLILEVRTSSLMCEKGGKPPESRTEAVCPYPGVVREYAIRLVGMQEMVGIQTVDHVNVMTRISECMRQTINVHCVTAE